MSTTRTEDAMRWGRPSKPDLREAIDQLPRHNCTDDTGEHGHWVNVHEVAALAEAYLREHDAHPKLGMATTHELITELMARADVAKTVGETWPLYSTVGGSDE